MPEKEPLRARKSRRKTDLGLNIFALLRDAMETKVALPNGKRMSKTELAILSQVNSWAQTGNAKYLEEFLRVLQPGNEPTIVHRKAPRIPSKMTDNTLYEAGLRFIEIMSADQPETHEDDDANRTDTFQ